MPNFVKVYFAHTAQTHSVYYAEMVRHYIQRLQRVDGVYLASTEADYRALSPHIYRR